MNRLAKTLALWFAMGAVYLVLEGVYRHGWTHIVMLPIGGICGVAVGALNQPIRRRRHKLRPAGQNTRDKAARKSGIPVWAQSLIGAAIVLGVEFVSGLIVNVWLGWGVWDYSGRWGNVMGQICPQYGLLWFALMPFAIWLEDTLRWRLWGEGETYGLRQVYIELVTGR